MNNIIVIVIGAFLALQVDSSSVDVNPLDIYDDANATYDRLLTSVSIESTIGLRRINTLDLQLQLISNITLNSGRIQLYELEEGALERLDNIKVQAINASADISVCLNETEPELNGLLQQYRSLLAYCIYQPLADVQIILKDATNVVNGTVTTVQNIGRDLVFCSQNLLCVSEILAAMNVQLIKLPQLIQDEVDDSQLLVGNAEVIVQTCEVSNVLRMTGHASTILRNIQICANSIINGSQ